MKLWDKGQKSEEEALSKIEKHFKGRAKIEKTGGHGQKKDALEGVDLRVVLDDKTHTAQVKPFSSVSMNKDKIELFDTGNVKSYSVDWYIFINSRTNKILIFKNNPVSDNKQYVFNVDSLLYEIE